MCYSISLLALCPVGMSTWDINTHDVTYHAVSLNRLHVRPWLIYVKRGRVG